MGKNKLDPINFCKILDMFGEEAASQTLDDVNAGKISEVTLLCDSTNFTAAQPQLHFLYTRLTS